MALPAKLILEIVTPDRSLVREEVEEGVVGELRLLQADDVLDPFVQPGEQSRQPLLRRVHVPGGDTHKLDSAAPLDFVILSI